MQPRSEKTRDYILEKVAPIFNKTGYHGTSMSTITAATGLTKGAVYGNFHDKEDLAIQAFEKNVNRVILAVRRDLDEHQCATDKLFALTDFYRNYFSFSKRVGGCPILNFGVDANFQNPRLLKKVKSSLRKLQKAIEKIIQMGIQAGDIQQNTNARKSAMMIFTILEGAIFMAFMSGDKSYLHQAADHIDEKLLKEMVS